MATDSASVGEKIVLITGGTVGSLGFNAACTLMKEGYKVVLGSRSEQKAKQAVEELQKLVPEGKPAEYVLMDLASFDSIRKGAADALKRFPRLDMLVCNAAYVPGKLEVAPEAGGFELSLATNHLSHFLLTHLLMPAIKQSPAGRVVVVTSELHDQLGKLPADPEYLFNIIDKSGGDAANPKLAAGYIPYAPLPVYSLTKLYNIWFTFHLAKILPPNVVCNCVTPGWVPYTNLIQNAPAVMRFFMKHVITWLPVALTPQQGGERIAHAISDPEAGKVSGKYFHKKQPMKSSDASLDEAKQKKLWELSCAAVGIQDSQYLNGA